MRLTRFTDNALRCLLYLAAIPSRTATVSEVAQRMGMSPDQVLKVIQRLVALGYVRTTRGRNGGVQLGKSADAITMAEVVRATEPTLALVPCFERCNTECPLTGVCGLADALDESQRAFFAVLERRTLADFVTPARWSLPGTAVTRSTNDT
jgi:Rrf2 family transcriptional regulator, nitric oxide-sensitive transcriptional repressor